LDSVRGETTAYIANNAPLTIALAKAAAREIGSLRPYEISTD